MRYLLVLLLLIWQICITRGADEITLDGSQYITDSMIVSPLHSDKNALGMIFRTSLSSCVLFFASGVSGDYIALELYRGRLRYVANSDGLTSGPTVEIIHGANYADGNIHQVNVEIGITTKLYTYSLLGKSNDSIVQSKAKDMQYDIDGKAFFMGLPITEKVNTKGILLSDRNFQGCLNQITFRKKDYTVTDFQNQTIPFSGRFNQGCSLTPPKFLKSFTTDSSELQVFSHVNDQSFYVELYYRTYLQHGMIFQSVLSKKSSSVSLYLVKNELRFDVNLTDQVHIRLSHHDKNNDNGIWRKVTAQISSAAVIFSIDKNVIKQSFNKTFKLSFPNKITFGEPWEDVPQFIGCMKDIILGKDKVPINDILRISKKAKFEENMCKMNDLCFPSRPCKNSGRCSQSNIKVMCDCTGTGFKGPTCSVEDLSHYKQTCSEYFNAGFKKNGMYTISPGSAKPFKVRCEMTNPNGPMTIVETHNKNETFVFKSKDKNEKFYFHQITYKASLQQRTELTRVSKFCRQRARYNCYQSTLLNSKSEFHRSSELGVRWYSKTGVVKKYWTGSADGPGGCSCGIHGNCASKKLLCNCDIMDQNRRVDDGFITDKNDLPVSKLRVSILYTNYASTFQLGDLQCTDHYNQHPTAVPLHSTETSNHIPFTKTKDKSANGVYHKGHNNNTDGILTNQKTSTNVILIDSKLLYIIIVGVVILIILFLLILVFKRRICCCYQEFKAKPQIIELYKDELSRNNNQNLIELSDDVTHNLDEVAIPLTHSMSTYPASCSNSSVSTIDPAHYYQEGGDSDCYSLQSNKSNLSIPKRGILKIKKDGIPISAIPPVPPKRNKSEESIARLKEFNKNLAKEREFNFELDNQELSSSLSPLKQKVLSLSTNSSTNNKKILGSELYFHQESNSSMHSSPHSSCVSSKESELNSDVEANETELERLTRQNKSVRFSDQKNVKRKSLPEDRTRRFPFETDECDDLLCSDEKKTLV